MHKNGKELKYTSASQQGGYKQNRKRDCGTPPRQGEYWRGLNSPILSKNIRVTGAKTNMLRKENRKKRHTCQEEQGPQTCWYTHEGKFKFPDELPPHGKNQNNMCP